MSDSVPFKPTGSDYEAHFHQKTHEALYGPARKVRNSRTVKVSYKHNGVFMRVKPPAGGGGGATVGVQIMQVVTVPNGDALTAALYDFSKGPSGSPLNVALPWELRGAQAPVPFVGTPAILPAYAAGDIIVAIFKPPGGTGIAGCDYMDLGLQRMWSLQLHFCNDGQPGTAYFVMTEFVPDP